MRDCMPVAQLDSLLGARARRAVHSPYQKENAGGRARAKKGCRAPGRGALGGALPLFAHLEKCAARTENIFIFRRWVRAARRRRMRAVGALGVAVTGRSLPGAFQWVARFFFYGFSEVCQSKRLK